MPAISGTLDVLYSEGDQLPSLSGVLKGIDLTGQIVRMTFKRPNDVLVKDATFPEPTCGVFEFVWDSGDLQVGSGQLIVLQLINATAESQTLARILLNVCEVPV